MAAVDEISSETSPQEETKVIHRVDCEFLGNVTQFKCCNSVGIKVRVLVICIVEMLALSYELATTILIAFKRDHTLTAWVTQPFIALAWKWEFATVLTVTIAVCVPCVAAVICLVQALDSNNPKLVIPHIVMQVVVIALLIVLAIITFSVLSPNPNYLYARRVAHLTAASISSGVAGVGNLVYGLEEDKKRQEKLVEFLRKYSRRPKPKPTPSKEVKNVTSVRLRRSNVVRLPNYRQHLRGEKAREFIWSHYDGGIWMLVGIVTYFSAAGLEMIALIVVMQCYYYLIELKKIADLV